MPGNFEFRDLTDETRRIMLAELADDEKEKSLYYSVCFSATGPRLYPQLMRAAMETYDEAWLAQELLDQGCFGERYTDKTGQDRKVASNAHTLFAQSEFNRFYCRALCLQAIADTSIRLTIYRARESSFQREGSMEKEDHLVVAQEVLDSLRGSVDEVSLFGRPDVGSGLSLWIQR